MVFLLIGVLIVILFFGVFNLGNGQKNDFFTLTSQLEVIDLKISSKKGEYAQMLIKYKNELANLSELEQNLSVLEYQNRKFELERFYTMQLNLIESDIENLKVKKSELKDDLCDQYCRALLNDNLL